MQRFTNIALLIAVVATPCASFSPATGGHNSPRQLSSGTRSAEISSSLQFSSIMVSDLLQNNDDVVSDTMSYDEMSHDLQAAHDIEPTFFATAATTEEVNDIVRDKMSFDIQAQQQAHHDLKALFLSTTKEAAAKEETAPILATTVEEIQTKKNNPMMKKKVAAAAHGKAGLFSPAVLLVKNAMGDDTNFNKLRAKVISIHSDVIASFVNSAETPFGQTVLKALFTVADADKSGTIEEQELAKAFQLLGFDWLKEKQVKGIFSRADKDKNGAIDMKEWLNEAPKTLRTNLIKLAKKNGGEMGLLA